MIIGIILQAALWIWFLGCVITWRIGKRLLVEGMGLKSAEFAVLCLYSAGLVAYYTLQSAGKWILTGILILWFVVEFFCHWFFTIFGSSERKLQGYNNCFRDTVHLVPLNEKRIIPDLYHMIQHLLILLNIIVCLWTV